MNINNKVKEVPSYLKTVYEMLERTFPDGVEESYYRPLLAALSENMSQRNLAHVLADFTGKLWSVVYNDVLGAASPDYAPSQAEVDRVIERLKPHGYEKWLQEE